MPETELINKIHRYVCPLSAWHPDWADAKGKELQHHACLELARSLICEVRRADWMPRAQSAEPLQCPTPGCSGDARYMPPGRGHIGGCRYDPGAPQQETP